MIVVGFLFLIEIFATILRSTETNNFLVLNGKFVIISDFLAKCNRLFRVNDDFLLCVNSNDFRITIGL